MKEIKSILNSQKSFFNSQQTKDLNFRLSVLKQLKNEIINSEFKVYEALKKDFNKSHFETFISEYGLVISSLNLVIKRLKKWAKPKRVKSSILTFPSKDYILKEPFGTVLVIGPWNYPFLLSLEPVIMAIAAGNTVVLKPSELTKHTSALVSKIIQSTCNMSLAFSIEGGIDISTKLLNEKWDYIFFTGSTKVGKIVAKAAAKHLTPITLELGGKSPCIIDGSVNLKLVAKRLVWGKFLNGGQTCIAPDYVVVKSNFKDKLVKAIKEEIKKAYGENPKKSNDFPRIINSKNHERISKLIKKETIIFGGEIDKEENYISPTLIDNPESNSSIMTEEIFGPVLPILSYNSEKDIEQIILNLEKPLAFYIFSKENGFIRKMITKFSFGGGVINDTLVHFGNKNLPFGGIGSSGMGRYHGKFGFDTFSHNKAILKRGTWIDPPFRYAPYKKKLGFLKRVFKYFG